MSFSINLVLILLFFLNFIIFSDVRRKPLSHRIGDIGQGGARTLAAALQGTRTGYNQGGRVGKRLGPLAGRLQAPARNLNRQSQASSNE